MNMMNWADYAIMGVIGLSLLISFIRGFVREALSLVTWIAAIWIAWHFYTDLANLLTDIIHTPSFRLIASFAILFIATLFVGAFVNYLLTQLIDNTGLSGTDRMLGIIFGAARGLLVVTVLIILARLTPLPQDDWWKDSLLIPRFASLELWMHDILPASVLEHLPTNNTTNDK